VKNEQGRAFVAFSKDAGRTFSAPIRVDDQGSLGRVDLELMADGAAVASWIEFADERAQFKMRRIERSGVRSPAVIVSSVAGSRASGYPRMAVEGDHLLFAWTEVTDGRSHVQTAMARTRAATDR
jgi:hypothetical protein